jgi:hypothetical protein
LEAMKRILIPAHSAEQWKSFLAEPDKQWRRGYSARTLAHCWHDAPGFPEEVKRVLHQAAPFRQIEMLIAIPEHQVSLPGGGKPSQNDLWVLAGCQDGLVSIAVEGKVAEPFGPTIQEWDYTSSAGKQERLEFLCSALNLSFPPPDHIRYQLFHRTVSAILEAKRYFAKYAVMLVHSFSESDQWVEDYKRFVSLFGVSGTPNQILSIDNQSDIPLFLCWVRGEKKYLDF